MSEITSVEKITTKSGDTQYRYTYDDGRVGVGRYDPTKTDPAYRLKRETGSDKSIDEIHGMMNRRNQDGSLNSLSTVKNALTLSASKPDMNTDYKALMDYAAEQGHMDAAAFYESMRNAKIDKMNADGTNTGGYGTTDDYSRYYDPNMDSNYTKYLMKSYGRGPTTYTDADMSRTVQDVIASLEAQGRYDEANAARAEWLYKKNYDTGEFEQMAQPDTWSWSSADYKALSSKDPAVRAEALKNTGVYGGAGGTLGDYRTGTDTLNGGAGMSGGSGYGYSSGYSGSGGSGGGYSGGYGYSGGGYSSGGTSGGGYSSGSASGAGGLWPGLSGGDGGLSELYDAAARASKAALDRSYNSAAAGYDGAKDSIYAQYYDAARKAQAQSDLQRLADNELFNANGLNTGAVGQAALAQGNALGSSLSAIDAAQAQSLAEVDTSLAKLRADYEGAVAEAIANNEMEKATALYQQYQQERERQIAWYQQLWQLNYQQELTKSAQARSLAQQQVDALVKQGIMPSDELIASSGYDRGYVLAMAESVYSAKNKMSSTGYGGYSGSEQNDNSPHDDDALWAVYPDGVIPAEVWGDVAAAQGGEAALLAKGFIKGGPGSADGDDSGGNVSDVTGYDSAIAYMKAAGVDGSVRSGLMTKGEWSRRKASLQQYSTGGTEVKNYNSYEDYIKDYCEYAASK